MTPSPRFHSGNRAMPTPLPLIATVNSARQSGLPATATRQCVGPAASGSPQDRSSEHDSGKNTLMRLMRYCYFNARGVGNRSFAIRQLSGAARWVRNDWKWVVSCHSFAPDEQSCSVVALERMPIRPSAHRKESSCQKAARARSWFRALRQRRNRLRRKRAEQRQGLSTDLCRALAYHRP